MSLLRTARNLAVLVILTVAALAFAPRPVAAQSTCQPLGGYCSTPLRNSQCCSGLCGSHNNCCQLPFRGMYCTSSVQCCSGFCYYRTSTIHYCL
jgi:hypothetical protein